MPDTDTEVRGHFEGDVNCGEFAWVFVCGVCGQRRFATEDQYEGLEAIACIFPHDGMGDL